MDRGTLFIVSAPSGAGKTSLLRAALEKEASLALSVSYTTRAPRPGEVNGEHYHFTDVPTFQAMKARGDLLESAEVYGNYYGTSRSRLEFALREGEDIILEIDWQGARQVRGQFPDAASVFILPPSVEALRERLTGRGQDTVEVIERRLAAAQEDMAHAGEFDYVIINQDFETALADLLAVFRAERLKGVRQQAKYPELFTDIVH